MVTQEYLKEHFDYIEGELIYKKIAKFNHISKIGDILGNKTQKGYKIASIKNKKYFLHRIIFLYHYGYLPEAIDHIDRNRSNNRIENLRACSNSENLYNTSTPKKNQSGAKNVGWDKVAKNWRVRINYQGKNISIGSFDNFEDAVVEATLARIKYHGEFAKHC